MKFPVALTTTTQSVFSFRAITGCAIAAMLQISGCASPNRSPAPSEIVSYDSVRQAGAAEKASLGENTSETQAAYHFSLGQSYSLEGNSDKAIEEYRLALIYDSSSAVIHTRLATEFVKKGLLTFAIEECKAAIKLDPKYVDARLLLAGLYGATKMTKEALAEYDQVLRAEPSNSEAHVFKASLLVEENRGAEAIATLKKLIVLDSESAMGFYYLGRAYHQLNQIDQSVAAYRKALELRSGFVQAALSLGQLLEEKGRNKEAIATYEQYFAENRDAQIAAKLSQHYIDKNDYKKALSYLLVLEQLDDDNLNAKVKIGLIYVELKQHGKAARMFESILARSPDAERVRFYLGSVYEELKRYDDAIMVFSQVPEDSSSFPEAAVHVGYLQKMKGNAQAALDWINKAISRNPDVSQYYTFKASLVEEAEGASAAIAVLEPVHMRFESDERLLYYLGSLYDKTANTDKALAVMEQLLVTNPNNVNALNYIGYTLATRGEKLESAETMIRKALSMKPDDAYIQDSLGYVLLRRGKYRQAVVELEKAYRMKPDEAVIAEHLGDAYLQNNLRSKALQKYADALKLYTDPTERSKLERKVHELDGDLQHAKSKNPDAALRVPAGRPDSEPSR